MKNTFEITSGVMVCSDPCYKINTWCQGIVENVKKGTWLTEVEKIDIENRIAVLKIEHTNAKKTYRLKELEFDGGVDSGQFGFFDKDFYRNDEEAKNLPKYDFGDNFDKEEGDEWYRSCCKITLEKDWGVLPHGVVSSSGYGDGSYQVLGKKDENGEWVALMVVFIHGDNEEDEEDFDEDEREYESEDEHDED
jgi:hypothetical protein